MYTKKSIEKNPKRDIAKDDNLITKKPEEKSKKSIYSVSTPRTFVQKTSAADVYARNNSAIQSVKTPKTPKKTLVTPSTRSNVLQTKDSLKSSHSSVSQISTKSYRGNESVSEVKAIPNIARYIEKSKLTAVSSRNMGVVKKLPLTNVTVNSPTANRRTNVDDLTKRDKREARQEQKKDERYKERVQTKDLIPNKALLPERKRTKTRTLDDEEIKILTPDVVDNNPDILNLTKNLSAQPKAFFIDLNGKEDKHEIKSKSSDEEVSYEDDFESYESDFESYHSSSQTDHSSITNDDNDNNDNDESDLKGSNKLMETGEFSKEEKMLDSGTFELRDPPTNDKIKRMHNIVEDIEEDGKKASLTDEGFQESFSSGLSSMKTLHVDVLGRPLFIDLKKSRENRRKQKILERFRQRINDILSMITLHEMSYSLFEMKPIPYDLYMATFGRFNYTQTAVQTYDDGISEEIQTDEIITYNKWTQHPIEFSPNYFGETNNRSKNYNHDSFAFLYYNEYELRNSVDDNNKYDPLRIYLQQRDGAGSDVLPYEIYKSKLKKDDYDVRKLRNFLKKTESRISYILNKNSGSISNLNKTSKFPFSNECLLLSTRDLNEEKFLYIKNSPIIGVIFSDANSNLVITLHNNTYSSIAFAKCALCLWDISISCLEPLKIMVAIDHVKIGRFRGGTDGFLVGALNDGSIHLWDLTEEPTWGNSVTSEENSTKTLNNGVIREIKCSDKKDSNLKTQRHTLRACAYTTSAMNVCNKEIVNSIVGLEFMGECSTDMDCKRKLLAQLCVLQSVGILTIWSIIQEKRKNLQSDIGKALWSKMKLERQQTINLINHIDVSVGGKEMEISEFNLISAKKRMSKKRSEINKPKISRRNFISKQDGSASITSGEKLVEITDECENSIVCSHLKVIKLNNIEKFLVAKNRGEVVCCTRNLGNLKLKFFCVAKPVSFVTCLEISPHGLPYFIAATDCGTVNLCSLLDYRVLLTLDCRIGPSSATDKCQAHYKGNYVGSFIVKSYHEHDPEVQLPITTVSWLHPNPFVITATFGDRVVVWELTHSDIRARCKSDGTCCIANEKTLALLTKDGDVQFFKLNHSKDTNLELFERYVALL